MDSTLRAKNLDYGMTYTLKKVDSVNIKNFHKFFASLPTDPYLEGTYRSRRLSRFQIHSHKLTKLPHEYFFQSRSYNSLLGEVKREYSELDDAITELDDFRNLVLAFVDTWKLNTESGIKVNVHQVRTTCSPNTYGEPVPEGIHKDGVDFVGIFAVNRENVQGGETQLYVSKQENPIFHKVLDPGELLVINDHRFFHFTTAIKCTSADKGVRDVFIFTFPCREKVPDKIAS